MPLLFGLAAAEVPSWGEMGLGLGALIVLAWALVQLQTKKPGIPPEVIQVIKDNTETNAKLVMTIQQLVKNTEELIHIVDQVQRLQMPLLMSVARIGEKEEDHGQVRQVP